MIAYPKLGRDLSLDLADLAQSLDPIERAQLIDALAAIAEKSRDDTVMSLQDPVVPAEARAVITELQMRYSKTQVAA